MFKEIYPHLDKIKVNMTIQRNGDELIVSVIPTIKGGEEAVNKAIPPFTVKGTPEELDQSFHNSFAEAATFITGKATDIEKWKKQADEAAQKSEAAKKLKEETEKKIKEKKEKAKKPIDLGDVQFKEKKYDAAKLYYREALSIMGGKDAGLEKKIAECDKLSGPGGLFGTTQSKVEVEKGTGDNQQLTGPAVAPTIEEKKEDSADANDIDSKSAKELDEEPVDEESNTDDSGTEFGEEDDDWA